MTYLRIYLMVGWPVFCKPNTFSYRQNRAQPERKMDYPLSHSVHALKMRSEVPLANGQLELVDNPPPPRYNRRSLRALRRVNQVGQTRSALTVEGRRIVYLIRWSSWCAGPGIQVNFEFYFKSLWRADGAY